MRVKWINFIIMCLIRFLKYFQKFQFVQGILLIIYILWCLINITSFTCINSCFRRRIFAQTFLNLLFHIVLMILYINCVAKTLVINFLYIPQVLFHNLFNTWSHISQSKPFWVHLKNILILVQQSTMILIMRV